MRPCGRCGLALENSAAACPRCGAADCDGPRATPGDPAGGPGPARELVEDLANAPETPLQVLGFLAWFVLSLPWLLLLSVPLAVGGLVGYLVGGVVGATVGVIAAMVVFLAVVAWREERRRR